ncbi:MAG: hypothetical protein UY23_C0005G0041 [Candidatus Jorgensenbacteria bacterium GW2011_GWA1_48_11]|uniref:Glycosyltransferase 2-like domain-containing protein n=1 Tax=Candidatus Jorgensenbacteria bacterium GW2011_GWA1_48_11 TaxID=1618660 RepID=A0A0G1X9B3_9BACT|nr:MAG: hypothetical protein UY23_C0005G0041 [Candidatus Jorgensenbacteria bacterium GW2011_GWA1_48_11]KKW12324.1 MAG: hypothetical protein UY51_C0005G0566 [Candidatus Jorgensenbacteria bacterium GW2011_GWB1_49_9]
MSQITITIIVPTFNSERYARSCLDSIFVQTYKGFEVIVFDNGSNDGTLNLVEEYPVKIVRSRENVGWARANNLCIRGVKTKYVFLLNIDTVLDPNCLRRLYEFAESKNDLGCVSPAIVEYSEFLSGKKTMGYPLTFDIRSGFIRAYDVNKEYVEVGFVPGTALFANLDRLQDQLCFREDFFMYHEDVELSLRIITKTGFKLYFLNTAIVAHDSKQSFSRFSTCRLALRNLFTCLVEYQNRKEFWEHFSAYGRSLFRLYKDFYCQYYPFTYPILGTFYLTASLFKLKENKSMDLSRLYEVNRKLDKWPKRFEFIF